METLIVTICRDGNQMSALIGSNIQEGTCGFGDTIGDALRDLAQAMDNTAQFILA